MKKGNHRFLRYTIIIGMLFISIVPVGAYYVSIAQVTDSEVYLPIISSGLNPSGAESTSTPLPSISPTDTPSPTSSNQPIQTSTPTSIPAPTIVPSPTLTLAHENLFNSLGLADTDLTNEQLTMLDMYTAEPTTNEINLVEIRFNLLDTSDEINLNLLLNTDINSVLERKEVHSADSYSWYGVNEDGLSNAIFVVDGNDVVGTIRTNDNLFRLYPIGDDLHVVILIDESAFPNDHPPQTQVGLLAATTLQESIYSRNSVVSSISGYGISTFENRSLLRVLVAYTSAALSEDPNIENVIQLAIDETNQSYINSDVNIRLQLANMYLTSYTEVDIPTDLDRFATPSDGFMDEVFAERNENNADIAILIGTSSYGSCGQASDIFTSLDSAFAVVRRTCATGNYSFGHEIGHILGARHNPEADNSVTPFPYGHGFRNDAGNWRTIMSYNCPGGCPRLQFWSNPNMSNATTNMGTVAQHDNARVLNQYVQGNWHDFFCISNEVCGVGDFDGDGKDDIILFKRNTGSGNRRGDVIVSLSDGTQFDPDAAQGGTAVWHDFFCIGDEVCGVGDFDGDGKDDIILFKRSTGSGNRRGDVIVSLSDGTQFDPDTTQGGTAVWHDFFCIGDEVCGVGDFNGDGKDDIILFKRNVGPGNTRGDVIISLSNWAGRWNAIGGQVSWSVQLSAWSIVSILYALQRDNLCVVSNDFLWKSRRRYDDCRGGFGA